MSETTRNRLIGVILLLAPLPFLLWIEVGGGMGKVFSFGTGALFGFAVVLVVTGRSLWDSETWWANKFPLQRI